MKKYIDIIYIAAILLTGCNFSIVGGVGDTSKKQAEIRLGIQQLSRRVSRISGR